MKEEKTNTYSLSLAKGDDSILFSHHPFTYKGREAKKVDGGYMLKIEPTAPKEDY